MKNLLPPLSIFALILFILLGVEACKKDDIFTAAHKTNALAASSERSGETNLDTMRNKLYDLYRDFYAVPDKHQIGLQWLADRAQTNGLINGNALSAVAPMVKDMATVGSDLNLSKIMDYMHDVYGMTAARRQFIEHLAAQLTTQYTSQAGFAQTESLLLTKQQEALDSGLPTDEKGKTILLLHFLRATFKYYNDFGSPGSPFNGEANDRSLCNDATALVIAGILGGLIGGELSGGGQSDGHGGIIFKDGAALGALIGAAASIAAYYLACNLITWIVQGGETVYCWLFGCDPMDCTGPDGFGFTPVGCNDVGVSLWTPGNSIVTFLWGAINGIVASPVTTVPYNIVTPIDPTKEVSVLVTTVCSDASTNMLNPIPFSPSTLLTSAGSVPTPIFTEGPATATVNQTCIYHVAQGTLGNVQLSWSLPLGGGTITQSGSDWAKVVWYYSGNKQIKATLTNTCSGATSSAVANTFVN